MIYRIKVSLIDVKPPIWRRLEIRSDTTLPELHAILISAMGWLGTHLHAFMTKTVTYGPSHALFPGQFEDERDVPLERVLTPDEPAIAWMYDFGDAWLHGIALEEILEPAVGPYPRCVAGRRACPPEDCGGIASYAALLATWPPRLTNDPALFSLSTVNADLAAFQRSVPIPVASAPSSASRVRKLDQLTPDDLETLERALEQPGVAFQFTLITIQAKLAGMISGPDMTLPSDWLPAIFENRTPDFAALSVIMNWWNQIAAHLEKREFAPLIAFEDGTVDVEAAFHWAYNYIQGLSMSPEAWQSINAVDGGSLVAPIATLLKARARTKGDLSKSKAACRAADLLPDAVADIYEYLREQRIAAVRIATEPIRRGPKIGRNDRCPCGSGRKYKVCCGADARS